MAKALELSSELKRPVRLNRNNLHPYRLKVKELRNVLQLSDRADDIEFVERLGQVKDAIGDWHDWEELVRIAKEVLDHGASCKLISQLKATSNSKYEYAVSSTDGLRNTYLKDRLTKHGSRPKKIRLVSTPVLRAASSIAE